MTDQPTTSVAMLAAQITLEIVDHLAVTEHGPSVLTGLGAAVIVELERFEVTIDQFVLSLRALKSGRDAELERRQREN